MRLQREYQRGSCEKVDCRLFVFVFEALALGCAD